MRSTPELGRAALERSGRHGLAAGPFRPCSRWGLPSRPGRPGRWWSLAPPFHPYLRPPERAEAVCSLWHFPAGHPGWELPTTSPCGARTFLDVTPRGADAVARPAHPRPQDRGVLAWGGERRRLRRAPADVGGRSRARHGVPAQPRAPRPVGPRAPRGLLHRGGPGGARGRTAGARRAGPDGPLGALVRRTG